MGGDGRGQGRGNITPTRRIPVGLTTLRHNNGHIEPVNISV